MNVAIKVVLFLAEVLVIGGMYALFANVVNFISPTFPVEHPEAYVVIAFCWTALPAVVLLGLIIKYVRKEEHVYHGGYF